MKMFEDFAEEKECFLVTWMEGGDEIIMALLSMEHYAEATRLMPNWNSDSEPFWEFIINNQIGEDFMIQTFCQEDFPFANYKIVKVIHVPML